MSKLISIGYLLLGFVALFIGYQIYKAFKSGATSISDATAAAWTATKNFAAAPVDKTLNSAPAQSVGNTLSNPVSTWVGSLFKSAAEKQVDKLYGHDPSSLPPGVDKKGGLNITNPTNNMLAGFAQDVFNIQQPLGIAAANPSPGPTTTSGRITQPSIYRSNLPRAEGDTSYSGSDNPLPPVNNTFEVPPYSTTDTAAAGGVSF